MTAIKRVENRGHTAVSLLDLENPEVLGHGVSISPGETLPVDMWIPWAAAEDFPQKHLQLLLDGRPHYWIWQAMNAPPASETASDRGS